MYISSFWCGVIACILVELAIVILSAVLIGMKDKKAVKQGAVQKPVLDDNNKN